MKRKPSEPARVDWLAIAQRVIVGVRGLRGDAHDAIEADHHRELERSQKLRTAIDNAEQWVKQNVSGE
jgi:hypothetical protein